MSLIKNFITSFVGTDKVTMANFNSKITEMNNIKGNNVQITSTTANTLGVSTPNNASVEDGLVKLKEDIDNIEPSPVTPTGTVVRFTSSQTWTVPSGVTKADVFLVGGGGAGGGDTAYPDYGNQYWFRNLAGGGGGGLCMYIQGMPLTAGDSISVVIGSGSTRPIEASTDGVYNHTGGTTSFGSLKVGGGLSGMWLGNTNSTGTGSFNYTEAWGGLGTGNGGASTQNSVNDSIGRSGADIHLFNQGDRQIEDFAEPCTNMYDVYTTLPTCNIISSGYCPIDGKIYADGGSGINGADVGTTYGASTRTPSISANVGTAGYVSAEKMITGATDAVANTGCGGCAGFPFGKGGSGIVIVRYYTTA